MNRRGALALVLHTHMPYVEGFGTWPFGEEWLWEALASVYLPLAGLLDGAPVTLGLTPVLCDQLELLPGEPGTRYLDFLRDYRDGIHDDDAAGLDSVGEHDTANELRRAKRDYLDAASDFEGRGGDLLGALGGLDGVELWTSGASHALLPLLATDAGRRLQLDAGIASHERRFGSFDGGLWLPECAYEPGLERDLHDHGVRAFCVDQTELHGYGALEQLEPVATDAGPLAVPIDWQTVELVWSGERGYPVHPRYRDYHRRTIHDLKPWANDGEPYRHDEALALAGEHAAAFVSRAIERLDRYEAERGRPGLIACALDTELLGHWWYEGPTWLAGVLEEAPRQGLDLVTVSQGLEQVEPVRRELAASTWGTAKDLSTWDSPAVADFAWRARDAELRTIAAAGRARAGDPALQRAARELLALQSSDWAFQLTHELAGDYPLERVRAHSRELDAALGALQDSGAVAEAGVRNLAPSVELAPLFAT